VSLRSARQAVGHLFRNLSAPKRALLAVGGFSLLIPVGLGGAVGWVSDVLGALIVAPLLWWEWRHRHGGAA